MEEIEATGVMKVQYTEIYNDYQKLFEESLSGFIEGVGSSVEEFFEVLRERSEEDPDGEDSIFARIVTATADFDIFMQVRRVGRGGERGGGTENGAGRGKLVHCLQTNKNNNKTDTHRSPPFLTHSSLSLLPSQMMQEAAQQLPDRK